MASISDKLDGVIKEFNELIEESGGTPPKYTGGLTIMEHVEHLGKLIDSMPHPDADAAEYAQQAAQSASEAAESASIAQGVEESIPDDYSELSADVEELKSALDNLYDLTENVLDPDNFNYGYIKSDGTIDTEDTGARTTDYLPVQGDYITHTAFIEAAYETQAKPIRAVGFYDENKTFISRDTSNINTYQMVSGAKYIRCSLVTSAIYGLDMLTWTQNKVDKWIAYRGKPSPYYSPLYGKSMVCLGDSICKGQNWTVDDPVYPNSNSGWAKLFRDTENMQVYGFGSNGATIRMIAGETNSIYYYFSLFTNNATTHGYAPDYMLIEGGVNDATRYYNGTDTDEDFGEIVDGYGQNNTYNETLGALERMFYTIKTTFPETKTIFVIPTHVSGDAFQPALKKYVDGIKKVCEKWSIPYIDLYTECRLNGCITSIREDYFDEYGVHPNEEGYKIITEDIKARMTSI